MKQKWGLNSQSEPMAPVTAQARNRASSLHKLNKQEMQNGKSPVGYVIAIQLHQIHQLAVKMNTKKMFKTLKTLGRKQSRNKYKPTRSFYFVSREFA